MVIESNIPVGARENTEVPTPPYYDTELVE